MNKYILSLLFLIICFTLSGQSVTTSPQFPSADQSVTFTVNAEGTSLEGYEGDVWIWTWLSQNCSENCDAPTNVNPATSNQSEALMARSGSNPDEYSITFTPSEFFNKDASEITQIGLKLKSADWADNIQTDEDLFVTFSDGSFEISRSQPAQDFLFVDNAQVLSIAATTNENADFTLFLDDVEIDQVSATSNYSFDLAIDQTEGNHVVRIEAANGEESVTSTFRYLVRTSVALEPRPNGILKGINYHEDPGKVTLCLWAPNNESAYVTGDFNDWKISGEFQMKRDGEFFWLQLDGLTAGEEYAFQYLVDEALYIADPYTEKVLDPDDVYIPDATYPNLKQYPEKALRDEWYYNRTSIFQTDQQAFDWTAVDYQKPSKNELVIYELLIRDYFAEGDRNYTMLTDTLDYLKKLGVNAIELMPIMEFNGNDSWGYNPAFMFAPDKYYGQKEDLKYFIDECHKNNMAVILDVTMNHQDIPSPFLMLDFDFQSMTPEATNKWFNQQATHPFNVFYDFNHESTYTQNLLDSVNTYWISEYNVDGYRFDLSKGFTQRVSGEDVGLWSSYDANRIATLKRMADVIWDADEDAYIILEHFADNSEERELANYGMMLWGNSHYAYSQLAMGYEEGATIDYGFYQTRGWDDPHLVTYMESHDEERLMYQLLNNGNSLGAYSTQNLVTALERVKAASALFYLQPGPKMLWQFGEFGYDVSIETNGRTGQKPVLWEYLEEENRNRLYKVTSELINLRNSYAVFSTTNVNIREEQKLVKEISLINLNAVEAPQEVADMNVHVVANMDISPKTVAIHFPSSGKWFSYFTGDSISVNSEETSIFLLPGEFRVYTDVVLPAVESEIINYSHPNAPTGLALSEVANEGVRLNWEDNSSIENSYRIWRKTEEEESYQELDILPANQSTYLDEEAIPNKSYRYYVEAKNSFGSGKGEEVSISTSSVLNVGRGTTNTSLKMYPNPADQYLLIETNYKNSSINVILTDLNGKEFLVEPIKTGDNILKVDLENIPRNLYLVRVLIDNTWYNSKFIKK